MSQTKLKVALLGDGSVGKSCLTIQFTQKSFMKHYDPTIENAYSKLVVVDGENIDLEIIDTAGQEEYKVMRAQYIRSAEGFMLVYSVTSRFSLQILQEIWDQIVDLRRKENSSIVLVGNKCDLNDEREVSKEEGEAFARRIGCFFFETSAKAGLNVDESFTTLLRETKQRMAKAAEVVKKHDAVGDGRKGGSMRQRSRTRSDSESTHGMKIFRSDSLRNIKEKMKRTRANTIREDDEEDGEKGSTKKQKTRPGRTRSFRFTKSKDALTKEDPKHEDDMKQGGKERCTIS